VRRPICGTRAHKAGDTIQGNMHSLLKHKVIVSKPVWLGVSVVAFALMSRTIIIHKGNDIWRLYQLWLLPFQAEYHDSSLLGLVLGSWWIILMTGVQLFLAALLGWLLAALLAGCIVVIGSRKTIHPRP
jgi:hypothetical protein